MKIINIITIIGLVLTSATGFLNTNKKINFRKKIVRNIQIDNDTPSFIAERIYKSTSTFGTPWTFTRFKEELESKNIEGVTFISDNNQIKQIIAIDNHHTLNDYNLYNVHNIKILPNLVDNILNKLDANHINYDFLDMTKQGFLDNVPFIIQFVGFYLTFA